MVWQPYSVDHHVQPSKWALLMIWYVTHFTHVHTFPPHPHTSHTLPQGYLPGCHTMNSVERPSSGVSSMSSSLSSRGEPPSLLPPSLPPFLLSPSSLFPFPFPSFPLSSSLPLGRSHLPHNNKIYHGASHCWHSSGHESMRSFRWWPITYQLVTFKIGPLLCSM